MQTSLQTRITEEIEDPWRFPYVTAEEGHYQEEACGWECDATELDASDNERGKYKVKAIHNSAVYARELAGHLPGLYYLVF